MYDEKVDIWSIGVITYQLVSGFFPFAPDCGRKALKHLIMNSEPRYDKAVFPDASQDCIDFIK
jgi:serine/threonine protein kinase